MNKFDVWAMLVKVFRLVWLARLAAVLCQLQTAVVLIQFCCRLNVLNNEATSVIIYGLIDHAVRHKTSHHAYPTTTR